MGTRICHRAKLILSSKLLEPKKVTKMTQPLKKPGGETANAAYIKKALVSVPASFQAKRVRILVSEWFLCWYDATVHIPAASVQDLKWQQRCNLLPDLFTRYRPSGHFHLPKGKVRVGRHLVVPGQLQDELGQGHPNHLQGKVHECLLEVDEPL